MTLSSGSPSTYSMANQQVSPCLPAPQRATRLEWCSPTVVFMTCMNRLRFSSSWATSR